MIKRLCILLAAIALPLSALADSWVCAAEQATGFAMVDGQWKATGFQVEETKYLVQPLEKPQKEPTGEVFTYGLFSLGQTSPFFFCQGPENGGPVICMRDAGQFKFDPAVGRYLYTHARGYWEGADSNEHTPFIEIGNCSKV